MTCAELTDLLVAFEADELGPAQREFVALHLDRCPACRRAHADLALTRRQLATMREEHWQPQLSQRIGRAIARQQKTERALRWGGWGLHLAGVAAAIWLVALSLTTILPPAPSGSGTGELIYVLGPGKQLFQVDTASRQVQTVAETDRIATMIESGGERFLLNNGFIDRVDPTTGILERLAAAQGQKLLAVSPDGSDLWLLHQHTMDTFSLNLVDAQDGGLSLDQTPKPGYIHSGNFSPDGHHLYLLGTFQEIPYLKVVDPATRQVILAHHLPGVRLWGPPPGPTALGAPDGKYVFVAGYDWLAVVPLDPETGASVQVFPVAGLTPAALLSPDGSTLIAAKNGGGLLAIDPLSGKVTRQVKGESYDRLTWSADGSLLYASSPFVLEARRPDNLARVGRPIPLR